ncbi:tetratricopeptide repeat protein [Streptomyces sp. NPDC006640]|uniref:tetratricopeptide repeat protein n=1 Tax=Streptomyces sp. NPDC006640 TaxID=3364754 RepID=UPI0036BB74E3
MDARQSGTLEAGLRAIARQAGASEDELRAGDAVDVLWSYAAQFERPWLLVVDNADDPALLNGPGRLSEGTGWIRAPAAGRGAVLVTSRDSTPQTWGGGCLLHPVRPLTGDGVTDAAQVLRDHAGERAGSFADARQLARRLGGLPLALRLAGTYLADANAVPAPYREPDMPVDFCSYQAALDRGLEHVDRANVIEQTWTMSLKLLEQQGMSLARPLLRLIATFADAPLPYTLLLTPKTLADAGELAQLDGPGVWTLLTALAGLGLVDFEPATGSSALPVLRVHPLVRDASLDHTALGTAIQAVHSSALASETGRPEDPDYWEHWTLLQPHALDLFHRIASSESTDQTIANAAATMANLAARHLRIKGLYGQAHTELEAVLVRRRAILGDTHPHTLSTRHELGLVLRDLGEVEQARTELEAVLAHRRAIWGDTHSDTLTARHNLAMVLRELGEVEQARTEFVAVLAHRRAILGDTHPDTLTARHELGMVLRQLGEVEQPRIEFMAVLTHRRAILGDTHPHTLTARHNLAMVLRELGEVEQARTELGAVLAHRRAILGDTHPHTLTARHNLAMVLREPGEVEQARTELEAVLAHRRAIWGDTHSDTLTVRQNLAMVLRELGEVEQARTELGAVLTHRRAILGDTHPDTLTARHNLAMVLRDLGEVEQARTELDSVLAHRRAILGDTHPHTLTARHNLAMVLRDLGEVEQARTEMEAVLAHRRAILGDTHPHTLTARHNLAALQQPRAVD